MSISYRKLDITVSADKETVLVFGQEMATKYFTEIVVTTMLNSCGHDQSKTDRILNDLHAAGLSATDYGMYSRGWMQSNELARAEAEKARKDAIAHQERMAALHATPAEIAADVARRKARDAEIVSRFGDRGKRAHFGG